MSLSKLNTKFFATLAIVAFTFSLKAQSANDKPAAQQASQVQFAAYEPENPGWLTNLDQAYEVSKKTGRPIMANFTGSDWCGWCKKLTAAVFSQPDFKTWAEQNVVLLELDYPRRKEIPELIKQQNANLQQAFQVGGYPTVWIFDLDKNKDKNEYSISALGRTGYKPSVEEFTTDVNNMLALRKK
jgi:thiol:disulfide interchange protein